MSRNRNWRPKGEGFRNHFDDGSVACWLRRNPDKTLTCVVYLNEERCEEHAGIWEITCRPGSPIIAEICDKACRVNWVAGDDMDDDYWGVYSYTRRPVPRGPRRGPKVRGYKSWARARPMSKHPKTWRIFMRRRRWWQLPRKFR
jgi:hypothetical protein